MYYDGMLNYSNIFLQMVQSSNDIFQKSEEQFEL